MIERLWVPEFSIATGREDLATCKAGRDTLSTFSPRGNLISWPRPVHTASSLSIQFGHRKTFQATWPGVDGSAHCPKSQLRGTRACRGAPGTDASLWTQWTTCAPRCGQQKNGRARRLSPQPVGARGCPAAQPGDPAQRREPLPLPLPGPARPRRPQRVGRRWRTPAEYTYLRGYIVSPLCYDSTSRILGWDLSAHHPGAVAPLFSLPLYSAVGRNPAPVCPIRGHLSRD